MSMISNKTQKRFFNISDIERIKKDEIIMLSKPKLVDKIMRMKGVFVRLRNSYLQLSLENEYLERRVKQLTKRISMVRESRTFQDIDRIMKRREIKQRKEE